MGSSRDIMIVERWTNGHPCIKFSQYMLIEFLKQMTFLTWVVLEPWPNFLCIYFLCISDRPFVAGVRMLFAGICLHEQRRYDSWCSIERHQKRDWHACCGGYSFDSVTQRWTTAWMTSPVEFFYYKSPDSQRTAQSIPCMSLLLRDNTSEICCKKSDLP